MNESEHAARSAEPPAPGPGKRVLPILVCLITGGFFAFLNETLLNIALHSLMDEFGIRVTTAQWMVTGFLLVTAIVTPVSAVLLQRFSTRRLFLGTMAVFTLGTALCAAAPAFPALVAGRFIQAVGTGLMTPVIFHAILLIVPPERRGRVMGLIGFVFMFAPAIGPTLSGLIVQFLGWRFLFLAVLPFALVSLAFAWKYLVDLSEVTKPRIDAASVLLSSAGFGGLVYGFSEAGRPEIGFLAPGAYIPILAGAIALVLFAFRQTRLDQPLLDLRVFRYPMFSHAVLLFLIIMMGMFGSEIVLPLYMQETLALPPSAAGMVLLPGSLLSALLSPLMGLLFDRYGPRKLLVPAAILLAFTTFGLTRLGTDTPVWFVSLKYVLLMASITAIWTPAETNGLNELPRKLYPHGTAIVSTLMPAAGAIGVSIFVSILSARRDALLGRAADPADPLTVAGATAAGVQFVYWISFASALAAVALAFLSYRARPPESEGEPPDPGGGPRADKRDR